MMSIRPITSRWRMRGKRQSFLDHSQDVIEIEEGGNTYVPPAICLPGELDRVTACHASTRDTVESQLRGTDVWQTPTRLYRVDDVLLADSAIMTKRAVSVIAPGARKPVVAGKVDMIDEALLCSTYHTELYFGHWIYDGWQREMLARDRMLRPIWLDRRPWVHEAGYRAILGTQRDAVARARIGRLWIADDGGLNRGRMARLARLRCQIRSASRSRGTKRVFLTRGHTGVGRKLVNEGAIGEALGRRGFVRLNPETEDAATIAATLHDARIVVTVEGSAARHAVMAVPDDAGFLFIQPAGRFNLTYHNHCGVAGQRFGYTVADDAADGNIHQPLDRLLKTLDLMEKAVDG